MYFLTVQEARSPKSRCQRGFTPSSGSRGENPSLHLPAFGSWHSLASLASGHITPISASIFTSVCHVFSSVCVYLGRIDVLAFRMHANNLGSPHLSILNLICKDPFFPIQVPSTFLGIRTWAYLFGEGDHLSTSIRGKNLVSFVVEIDTLILNLTWK